LYNKQTKKEIMKDLLLKGETLEFTTDTEDGILIWFSKRSKCFCLELNAKIIKSTKTFKPIENRLSEFSGLMEVF
jgi:hypothetical protein